MNRVLNQMLTFFTNLARNSYLTGKHRLVAQFDSGTISYEQAQLVSRHQEAMRLWADHPFAGDESGEILNEFLATQIITILRIYDHADFPVSLALKEIIIASFLQFTEREPTLFAAPESLPDLAGASFKAQTRIKRKLNRTIKHYQQTEHYVQLWIEDVANIMLEILMRLKLPQTDNSGQFEFLKLETKLFEFATDPAGLVDMCFASVTSESAERDEFFQLIAWQLIQNFNALTGVDHHAKAGITVDRLMAKQPGIKTAEKLLNNSPFETLLMADYPISIPEKVRFEHMHILAGTGHGKTQALQHLILQDLQRPADQVPAMVILDSQGDMLNNLKRLALFDPKTEQSLAERLLIVDPSDVEYAPSLNLFDIQSDRLKDYNQKDREQVLAGIIEIYDYIFGGLLGAELTQKQSMVFRFLAQLMLAIPGATIHTLRDLLVDASPFMGYVSELPSTARSFFETQFFERGYTATREQILRRLYGVLQNPSFERMFASPKNRLDLFPVLNEGGIVLANTAKDFMKTEASSIFGRYIIALTFKAAMERAIMPEHQRQPTFLWVDEASEYFDDNIDSLLIQARKYKLGIVMAHQYLGQLPRGLPASMMTNTSIKLAGGLSDKDSRDMAREIRTSPDFINSMNKENAQTNFAAYARNITPQAMKLTIPFGTAENLPQMSEESFEILRDVSRKRLSVSNLEKDEGNLNSETEFKTDSTTLPDEDEFWEPIK
ncbi:MAG: hypothetical protein DHS20C08_16160 [Rhodomicrobium sp.]|nr:MAG: hypothetical protein DHS20C08_16160 [Rhodomicrobium sp.]